MRKFILHITSLFFMQIGFAQELPSPTEEKVFEIKEVDVEPSFPRGMDIFYNFFQKKYKAPEVPQLLGKVFLSFIVEKDGSLTDIRTIKDIGFGTGIEAERVLELSPKWIPGLKQGKPVRVLYILPIPIQTE